MGKGLTEKLLLLLLRHRQVVFEMVKPKRHELQVAFGHLL